MRVLKWIVIRASGRACAGAGEGLWHIRNRMDGTRVSEEKLKSCRHLMAGVARGSLGHEELFLDYKSLHPKHLRTRAANLRFSDKCN